MAYSGSLEISNKDLRYVQLDGTMMIFGYEDGRIIRVNFTGPRIARTYYHERDYVRPDDPPSSFNLEGIEEVEYDTSPQ